MAVFLCHHFPPWICTQNEFCFGGKPLLCKQCHKCYILLMIYSWVPVFQRSLSVGMAPKREVKAFCCLLCCVFCGVVPDYYLKPVCFVFCLEFDSLTGT